MDISCNLAELLRHLQLVERGSSRKSSIQVLSGIRITAHGQELHLAATDMEMSIRTRLDATVVHEGVAVVGSKKLMEIIRALGGKEVRFYLNESLLYIESDDAVFTQNTFNEEDFPQLPPTTGSIFSLDRDVLIDTITSVGRAASTEESRPILTGIKVQISSEMIEMVATDSYRLSVHETKTDIGIVDPLTAIIPARALKEMARIADASSAASIAVGIDGPTILFGINDTWITARRIEGQFPNHQQLIPQTFEHEAVIDRADLLEVISRANIMADRSPLRLSFTHNQLTVSSATQDVGAVVETLPIKYEGSDIEIGFNAEYLKDGVKSFNADTIILKMISPIRPGLIHSASESTRYLIMPVRLPDPIDTQHLKATNTTSNSANTPA